MSLETYRKAEQPTPKTMLRWHLYGAGFENLGRDDRPEEVEVPSFGPGELLVRQDACGLCFSDTKVIGLGSNHPRMAGRDMAADPVTLGHEVACTVVGVGEQLQDRFRIGDRFVIQADVFYRGKSISYGYVIPGGLAEYSVIPKAILEGDEGCYLLPVQSSTGYVESALTEPWACVISSYTLKHRTGVKPGGRMLLLIGEGCDPASLDWEDLLAPDRRPGIVQSFAPQEVGADLWLEGDGGASWSLAEPSIPWGQWDRFLQEQPNVKFDDILILGEVEPERVEAAAARLADHGVVNLVRNTPLLRKLSLDVGRIHYNGHHYLGTHRNRPPEAYRESRTADLLDGGIAWFIGAGGPMGQMHVQRAVQHPHPPRRIVASDLDEVRLTSLEERFGALARERGIDLILLNPKEIGEGRFNSELERLGEGRGFDDIVCLVPAASVIEYAADFLAPAGWFNIFAGVARGVMARLNIDKVIRDGCRFLGGSGSSLADMRSTLERVERGELSTNVSLAAIGGMEAAKEGLRAVKEGWFPGKTLIFPQIRNLPLTSLADLKQNLPSVYAKLRDGRFWTLEAEEELFRLELDARMASGM